MLLLHIAVSMQWAVPRWELCITWEYGYSDRISDKWYNYCLLLHALAAEVQLCIRYIFHH